MDGRDGMAYQGSASYYLNRGAAAGPGKPVPGPKMHGGPSGASQPAGMHHTQAPPGFKNLSNPNISVQHSVGDSGGGSRSASGDPCFHMENPSVNFAHGKSMAIVAAGPREGEIVKKKRGRPRKYGPDGANTSLGLSPLPGSKNSFGEMGFGEKKPKGRPRGSGWKQKLASLGEWMNSSAGLAFTPHVLRVAAGEDIAAKILAFAQQRARALCIMSGNGSVSTLTLRQPTTSGATVTYEGRFEILCLSGSYLVAEGGGPLNRMGGITISVCSPDGHIIGGAVGRSLTAASPVQVVACSFVYGNTKAKADANLLEDQSFEKCKSESDIDLMRG